MNRTHIAFAMASVAFLALLVAIVGLLKFNEPDDSPDAAGDKAIQPADLQGSWIEPVPGKGSAKQGFKLEARGLASSINMATLTYRTWHFADGQLTLFGDSCGNGGCSDFSEVFIVESAGQKKLRLIDEHGRTREYSSP